MTVRTVTRRGKRRYVIDIPYMKSNGTRGRFRRDAEVQNLNSARAEDRRRLGWLANTGSPHESSNEVAKVTAETVRDPAAESVTITEAAKRFLDVYGTTRLKPSTKRAYGVIIDGFLVPRVGDEPLSSVDAVMIRSLDKILVKRGSKPSTRRQMQCVLRSICRYSVEAGLLAEKPRFPALPKAGGTIHVSLTQEDVQCILAVTPQPFRLAFQLGAFAGLRAGEVRGLNWKDVELGRGALVVRRSICRGVEASPKSGHERLVPLHPELKTVLEAAKRAPSTAPVSGPKPGDRWDEFTLYRAFKKYSKRAGFPDLRLHDLRHAFVTGLFRRGTPAPVVQRLAGHKHLTTTQRYAHAVERELFEAIETLGGNVAVTGGAERPGDQPPSA